MKFLYLCLPFLMAQSCQSQTAPYTYNKDDNSLLWEISGKGTSKPSYLFGTFHLMCKEDINPGKNLQAIIKNADEVYFEMDLDDASNTLGALFVMNMRNNTTLKDLYTEAEFQKISDFFSDSLKMSITMFQRIKPLFLQAMLYPKMMTCKSMSGMEEALMRIAKQHNKEIKGFETIAFQASVFDSIPYEMQAKELLKGIDSINYYKKDFDTLLNVYKNQLLSDIEKMNAEEFDEPGYREILLDKRNFNWIKQLKELLGKKSLFVGVGAGHLVGTNGLIELLRKEGYTVRPVENK